MSISTLAKGFVAGAKARKPEIMIGFGILAGGGAIIMAVKETPKCLYAFEDAKQDVSYVEVNEETGDETVVYPDVDWKTKLTIYGKSYWIAALLEAASIFLIVYGSKIRFSGYTALAAVYGVTKAELDDLKGVIAAQPDKWRKNFAEKKAETHLDASDVKDIPAPSMSNTEVPMALPLFWDDQAKVYFRLSEEDLRDALAEFTNEIITDPFQATTMNDWMRLIGHEDVVNGDYFLMTAQDSDWDGALKYTQIGVKEAPNGEPCRMMTFNRDYRLDTRGMYNLV